MTDDSNQVLTELDRTDDALAGSNLLVDLGPGLFGQQQAGWLVTIETRDGLVQIDTGDQAAASLAAIRARTGAPFTDIVFSHGHQRYNLACRDWVIDCVRSHGRVPRVIAHENVPRRQRRYQQSNGVQNRLLERQFRYPPGSLGDRQFPFTTPTHTFRDSFTIETPGRTIDVLHAPSETDDAVAVWLREDRVLYGGPACIPFFPNVGSPQRPVRDPVRWADTLDRLAEFPAELLIREFGEPVTGRTQILDYLGSTAVALRWCHDTVVDLMNLGHNVAEIVNMVTFPPEIFDRPWLQEGYTSLEHVLRDVYRTQFGWWEDLNPTSLHPAHPADVAREVRSTITDPQTVLDRAVALAEAGELQLALHVVDLLALDTGTDPAVVEARRLKATLCRRAAAANPSYVTQSLYLNAADALEGSVAQADA
jgi:glyoxylase-like metal-dependent hydrolase (beta-lactamase superfamily II)